MAKGNVARSRSTAGTKSAASARTGTRAAGKSRGNNGTQDPEFVQLLTPDGERVEQAGYSVDFTDDEYRGLYRDMAIVRRLDAEATALQRQGELGIWASLLGQEAAQIGSGRALRPQDMAFPTYREHGVLWCRGIDPIMPLGLFRGVDFGGWDSRATKMQMYTVVIGAQTLHATGYAMGVAKDGKCGGDDDNVNEAVIAYFGDGATSEGDVNESFVWASVFNAPIVFFCQNNQYAISEPVERQARAPIFQRAHGYGFPGIRVDGNDVLATYAVTEAALDAARHGEGPSMIEAYTYRMGAHTTSDDPTRYRIASEVEAWQQKDPILRLRRFLEKQQIADTSYFEKIDAEADGHAADLRARVLALPDPDPATMFDNVYPNGSPLLVAQREQFVAYHAGFESEGSGH
jgi:pyruvate dehydrogenase E1 component alpha subunit